VAAALGCGVVTMAVALAIRPLKLGEPGALLTGLRTGMTGACADRADAGAAAADAFLDPTCCVAAEAWLPVDLPRGAAAGLCWFFAVLERDVAPLPATALAWAGVDAGLRAAALLVSAALPGLRAAAALLAGTGTRLPALATADCFFPADAIFTPEPFLTPGFVAGVACAAVRAGLAGLLDLRAGLTVRAGVAFAAVFLAAAFTAGLVARVDAGLPPLATDAAVALARVAARPDALDFPFVCTLSGLKRPLFFAISSHHALAAAVGFYNPCVLYRQAHIWNTCADLH